MRKWIFLFVILAIVGGLPALLSTSPGNSLLRGFLGWKMGAQVPAGRFSLSWASPQKVAELKIEKDQVEVAVDELSIDQGMLPFLFGTRTPLKGKGIVLQKEGHQIVLDALELTSDAWQLSGRTMTNSTPGTFESQGSYKQPSHLVADAECTHFPLRTLVEIANTFSEKPLVIGTEHLGQNLTVMLRSDESGLALSATSDELQVALRGAMTPSHFTLLEPAIITWQKPALALSSLSLQSEGPLQIQVTRGTLSFDDPYKSSIEAQLLLNGLSLTSGDKGYSVGNVQLHLLSPAIAQTVTYDVESDILQGSGSFEFGQGGHFTGRLMDHLWLGQNSTLTFTGDQKQWKAEVKSSLMQSLLVGRYSPKEFSLERGDIDYRITPDLIQNIGNVPLQLNGPALSHIEIKPFSCKWTDVASSPLEAQYTLDPFTVSSGRGEKAQFENVMGKASYRSDTLLFTLSGDVEKKGAIALENSLNLAKRKWSLKSDLKGFPTALISPFIPSRLSLHSLLGPEFSLKAELNHSPKKRLLAIDGKSDRFAIAGAFDYTQKLRLSGGPAQMHLLIDPNTLAEMKDFQVESAADLKIQLKEIEWPLLPQEGWLPELSTDLTQVGLDASATWQPLAIQDTRSGDKLSIEKGSLSVKKNEAKQGISYQSSFALSDGKKSGQVSLNGSAYNVIGSGELTADVKAKLSSLPARALDVAAKILKFERAPFAALFGETIDATLEGKFGAKNSDFEVALNTSQIQTQARALIQEGRLLLKEPLNAKVILTSGLSDVLFQNANFQILSTNQPASLFIDSKGFSLPILPLDLSQFQTSKMVLDLGQIQVANIGGAQSVGSLFRLEMRSPSTQLWFAPMEMQVRSGILWIGRTEILYNRSLDIATWGSINLPRRYVDMIIGLTAQSLQAALGIQDLNARYVLKVPMKGPYGQVRVATEKAVAKIALLIARKQAGAHGGTWGGVLDAIGELADDQSDVPPPKRPFPWER